MDQSQFLAITCNSLEAREKPRVHGAIGFGFASHWLKNWRDSFKPITKHSNRNHVITFDSHLKTALMGFICMHESITGVLVPRLPLEKPIIHIQLMRESYIQLTRESYKVDKLT